MEVTQTDEKFEPDDSPTYWFAVLEMAKRSNDFRLAAKAVGELERLGVVVEYRQPKGGR